MSVDGLVPKSANRIVIHSFPDLDDQGIALCFALVAQSCRHDIVWLVEKVTNVHRTRIAALGLSGRVRLVQKLSLSGAWSFLRCRWLFYTHGLFFSYRSRLRVVVNLQHGMPFKKTWLAVPHSVVPDADYILSTSPFFTKIWTQISGFSPERIIELGLPRNELINRHAEGPAASRAVLEKFFSPLGSRQKVFLFLPTYRQSVVGFITNDGTETDSVLGLTLDEASTLRAWLAHNNVMLIVKPHPMSVHHGREYEAGDNILIFDETDFMRSEVGLYELLGGVDLLITDVSSIYVDNLVTDTPVVFFFPDIDVYRRTRGLLVEPIEDYLAGPLTRTLPELLEALDEVVAGRDVWAGKREQMRQLLNPPRPTTPARALVRRLGLEDAPSGGRVALVWSQYGPYHFARLAAARRGHGPGVVLGIEIASGTSTYAWRRDAAVPEDFFTLFPGCATEDVSSARVYVRLLALLRAQQVQVVFVPSYWPVSSLAILLAAKLAGARCVMMNESHAGTAKARGLLQTVKRRLIQTFDAGFVGGTPHVRYFEGLGLSGDRLFQGYDAVDNTHFQDRGRAVRADADRVRAELGLPARFFLNVGRMVAKKNLAMLVEAYALASREAKQRSEVRDQRSDAGGQRSEVRGQRSDSEGAGERDRERVGERFSGSAGIFPGPFPALVLVGSGPLEDSLRRLCLDRGLTVVECQRPRPFGSRPVVGADVYFHGFRQVDELPGFYALAEAFILPSKEEEWGLVVNEAMAAGCPVLVSSAAGCCEDLVEEGVNGWSFAPARPQQLAELLHHLADDPARVRRMGDASTARIAQWGTDRFAQNFWRAAEAAIGQVTSSK